MVAYSSKSFMDAEKKIGEYVNSSYLINSDEVWGQPIVSISTAGELVTYEGVYAQPRVSSPKDPQIDADLMTELSMWEEASEWDIAQAEASLDDEEKD